jgi:hypothetical protein
MKVGLSSIQVDESREFEADVCLGLSEEGMDIEGARAPIVRIRHYAGRFGVIGDIKL